MNKAEIRHARAVRTAILLFSGIIFPILIFIASPASAVGIDAGGTADVACDTPAMTGHTMNVSAGIYTYNFAGKCTVMHGKSASTYGYSVVAVWNQLKKEALETITSWEEGMLFNTIDYVVSGCGADPWISLPSCTLKSATKYSGYGSLVNPPFPKTASAVNDEQRAALRLEKKKAEAAATVPGIQLPTPPGVPPPARADLSVAPRPDYCAEYKADPYSTGINQTTPVMVTVKNCGGKDWNKGAGSLSPVLASYHWYLASAPAAPKPPVWDGRRSDPGPVNAGAKTTTRMFVESPSKGGSYILRIDMVQEGVTWFSQKGVASFDLPVTIVEPPPPSKVIGAPSKGSPIFERQNKSQPPQGPAR
jgi:hypothetical protein